jgi:hypothetical protein
MMEEPDKSNELLAKVMAGLFAGFIAPILAGLALWFIQKKLDEPKPDAAGNAPAQATAPSNSPPSAAEPKSRPKSPTDPSEAPKLASVSTAVSPPVSAPKPALTTTPSSHRPLLKKKALAAAKLFNGHDLSGFELYLASTTQGGPSYAKSSDPEKVFTVQSGQLHISGKVFGGMLSLREYENYHLTLEYRWGERRWPPRANMQRMSAVVLHAFGDPGEFSGRTMMAGITCVISEHDAGSLVIPDGLPKPIRLRAEAEKLTPKKSERSVYVYKPGEPATVLESGTIHHLNYHAPQGKAAVGKNAAGKAARGLVTPVGEWNRLECICAGNRITIVVNGTTVNVVNRVSHSRGKIFIESRGAEISFRTLDLRPLPGS